jgi:hypothetical protein
MANFQHSAAFAAIGIVLSIVFMLGLVALGLSAVSPEAAKRLNYHSLSFRHWLTWTALAMMLCGMLANERLLSYMSHDGIFETATVLRIRLFQMILILGGLTLVALRRKMAAILDRLQVAFALESTQSLLDIRIFLLSLLIPWAILLTVVENVSHLERLLWLWPLQVVVLAAVASYVPWQLQASRAVSWMCLLSLLVLIVANPLLLSRVRAWYRDGWLGSDPDQARVVQYVASYLNGRKQAAIGYQTFIWQFMAMYHAVDPRYKVGAEFDLLFKDRYKILNSDSCGEGVSANDEFRIVQTKFAWTDLNGKGYFDIKPDKSFVFLKQFGAYQVFQRQ